MKIAVEGERCTRSLAALGFFLASSACATTHYDWGRYEDSVYAVTIRPDGFDLAKEIDSLEQQLLATTNHDRLPPPGLHAHLGYLHSVAGNVEAARTHFENEKRIFPESAHFMDQLIARLPPKA